MVIFCSGDGWEGGAAGTEGLAAGGNTSGDGAADVVGGVIGGVMGDIGRLCPNSLVLVEEDELSVLEGEHTRPTRTPPRRETSSISATQDLPAAEPRAPRAAVEQEKTSVRAPMSCR